MRSIPCLLLTVACSVVHAAEAPKVPEAPKVAEAPKVVPSVKLDLPPVIYTVPGIEANIYFDNVSLCVNPKNYVFDVTCNRGKQQVERWTYMPSEKDVGQFTLRLDVLDGANRVVASDTTMIKVSPQKAGAGVPASILIMGDSLTAATIYPTQVHENCQAEGNPALTMVGSVARGPVRHEGYGGWTAHRFATYHLPNGSARTGKRATSGSPFLYKKEDGTFALDYGRYCQDMNGGKAPDYVTILLGCNDTFSASDETIEERIATMLEHYDTLVAMIHKLNPKTKIGVLLLAPPAGTQDAFGANYRSGQTRWQYKRNQFRVVERLTEQYGKREKEGIYIVPANANLDCLRNYPSRNAAPNARATVKELRLSNGVHPGAAGYKQLGDTIYCWLKAMLAKSAK